jgi:hypothetical protein
VPEPKSPPPDPAAALRGLQSSVKEVAAYAGQFVSAKIDGYVALARNLALLAVLLTIVAVIGLAILITAAALAVIGLAGLVSALIGSAWAGPLIVGGGLTLLVPLVTWLGIKSFQSAAYRAAVRRYDRLQVAQHAATGHTAAGRAAEADERPDPTRPDVAPTREPGDLAAAAAELRQQKAGS